MNRIALLTVLLISIPAASYASPHGPVAEGDGVRVVIHADVHNDASWNRERYDRYEHSHWSRDFRGKWEPLAQGYNARSDRQFINIGGNGRYRKLRIEAVRGEPVLLKIAIEFMDRTSQAVEYRETLPTGTGEVIDLNGGDRRIKRIIIYTDPHSRGSYSVYGS
jgi:hypothetical protein